MKYLGVATDRLLKSIKKEIQAMIDASIAFVIGQWVVNQTVVNGQTVTLPNTNQDITLNLLTGGASLTSVTVALPSNSDGRIGQRCFVNSNGQIADVIFISTNQVNNSEVAFGAGDNYVYYRNMANIWSRITS